MKEIALFGTGSGLELFFSHYDPSVSGTVKLIYDNNPNCTEIRGIPVVKPNVINPEKLGIQQVLITSRHYVEIYNQLLVNGLQPPQIQVYHPLLSF